MFRQAITRTDWDTVEGDGGFDVVMEEVVQREQENPASNARKMIDDFRLAGSRTWRRRGGPPAKRGGPPRWPTSRPPTTRLSQRAEPSPLWSRTSTKPRIRRGTTRIPRVGWGKAKRGCASRVPLPPGATARRTGGVLVVRATPPFWALVRHRGGVGGPPLGPPTPPGSGRSLSPQ